MTAQQSSTDVQTVTYYLVLLRPGENYHQAEHHYKAHVQFITALESAGSVLLGGSFETPLEGAEGGYLLYAASPSEARNIAGRDPLVCTGIFDAEIVEWKLVGICRRAIDPTF